MLFLPLLPLPSAQIPVIGLSRLVRSGAAKAAARLRGRRERSGDGQ